MQFGCIAAAQKEIVSVQKQIVSAAESAASTSAFWIAVQKLPSGRSDSSELVRMAANEVAALILANVDIFVLHSHAEDRLLAQTVAALHETSTTTAEEMARAKAAYNAAISRGQSSCGVRACAAS